MSTLRIAVDASRHRRRLVVNALTEIIDYKSPWSGLASSDVHELATALTDLRDAIKRRDEQLVPLEDGHLTSP
jgi:hypothetical protein